MNRTIPDRESITVEFKSDRNRLPDRDLVTAVVCLANTEGGELYLGIEKEAPLPASIPNTKTWPPWPRSSPTAPARPSVCA